MNVIKASDFRRLEQQLNLTKKLIEKSDKEFEFPSNKPKDFNKFIEISTKAFQIYDLCANEFCFELDLLNLTPISLFFKRFVGSLYNQLNYSHKMIIEQINIIRKNPMFTDKNDENNDEQNTNENNSAFDGTSARPRNSLVEDFDRINNLTRMQIENVKQPLQPPPPLQISSNFRMSIQMKYEESNIMLKNQLNSLNGAHFQLQKQHKEVLALLAQKQDEKKKLEDELIKTIKSNIQTQNQKINENLKNNSPKAPNGSAAVNMSVDDYLKSVLNKPKNIQANSPSKEDEKKKDIPKTELQTEQDKLDDLEFAEMKQILEKRDKMFAKVKDSGAGKELKQLQKAITHQRKNFNNMGTESIFNQNNNEDEDEIMTPQEPKKVETAKKVVSVVMKRTSTMTKPKQPQVAKVEMKERGTQPDAMIFDIGIIDALNFKVNQQKKNLADLAKSLEEKSVAFNKSEMDKMDYKSQADSEKKKFLEIKTKFVTIEFEFSKQKNELRDAGAQKTLLQEKLGKKVRKIEYLKAQIAGLGKPNEKNEMKNVELEEKISNKLRLMELQRENEDLKHKLEELKEKLQLLEGENEALQKNGESLIKSLSKTKEKFLNEKKNLSEKNAALKRIIDSNPTTKADLDQKIENGLITTDLPISDFDMPSSERELIGKFIDRKKPEPLENNRSHASNFNSESKKKIEAEKKKDPSSISKSKIEKETKEAKETKETKETKSKSKEPKKESQNPPSKPPPKAIKEKQEKKIDIPKKVTNIKLSEAPLPPRLEPQPQPQLQPQPNVKKAAMKEKGIQTDIIKANKKLSKAELDIPERDNFTPSSQAEKSKDITKNNPKIIKNNDDDSADKEEEKVEIKKVQKVNEVKNVVSEKSIPSKKDLAKDSISEISEGIIPRQVENNFKPNPISDPLKAQIAAKDSIIQELTRKLEEAKRKNDEEKIRNKESEKKIKNEIAEVYLKKNDEQLKYFNKSCQTVLLPELLNSNSNPNSYPNPYSNPKLNNNANNIQTKGDNNKSNNIKEIRDRIKTLSNHDISNMNNMNENETSFPSINFSKYREVGGEEPEVNEEEEKFSQIYKTMSKMVEKNGIHIFLNLNEDLDAIFKKIYAIKKQNDDNDVGFLKMPDISQFKEIMRTIDKEHERCGGSGGLCGHLKRFYEKLGWKEEKWGRKVYKVHKRDINKLKIL